MRKLQDCRAGGLLLLCGGLAGCLGGTGPELPILPAAACVVSNDEARANLNVAIARTVDPARAPAPGNAAERLVFRQLYQTLVWLDCMGTLQPGLAASWSASQEGRIWQFRLNSNARFWDGAPVNARAVVESWSGSTRLSAALSNVSVLGEHELRVELHQPATQPYHLAHPDLAVVRRSNGGPWPEGTGAFRIDAASTARTIRLSLRDTASGLPDTIEFRVMNNADPRRAIDARIDALVSSDAATLEYARAIPDYRVQPLDWNRTYVMITRAPQAAPDSGAVPADALQGMARAAVRTDTRPAQPPFWWQSEPCKSALPTVPTTISEGGIDNAIVYFRGDPVARGIAERLVALTWPPRAAPPWLRALLPTDYARAGAPVAVGVDDRDLAEQSGSALAFVLPLPRLDSGLCLSTNLLATDPLTLELAKLRPGWHPTALLDARDHLVHKPGLGQAVVDSDGTIRFQSRIR